MRLTTLVVSMVAVLALAGCGDSGGNAPPAAAMAPRPAPVVQKIPTTVEEKVQAIQNSSAPEKEKQIAIQKVRSGSL